MQSLLTRQRAQRLIRWIEWGLFNLNMRVFEHQGQRCLASQVCRMAGLTPEQSSVPRAMTLLGLRTPRLFHLDLWPPAYQEAYLHDPPGAAAGLLRMIIRRGEDAVWGTL